MLPFLRDCRTATLHVELARGHALPWRPRLLLLAHLLYCSKCRRYARQTQLLEELARPRPADAAIRLPEGARERLLQRLREAGPQ